MQSITLARGDILVYGYVHRGSRSDSGANLERADPTYAPSGPAHAVEHLRMT
jgi:hypothetical protein